MSDVEQWEHDEQRAIEQELARVKQERDELAAMVEVMRDALVTAKNTLESWDGACTENVAATFYCTDELDSVRKALSLTGPSALHEIRAEVLEEAAAWFEEESYTERDEHGNVINFAEDVLRRQAAAERAKTKRCEYCDGTGDVHRADGEWLGECTECGAAAERAKGEK